MSEHTKIFDEKPTLDLGKTHFMHSHGDITVIGAWAPVEDELTDEPAIYFMASFRKSMICAIALSAAYKYDDHRYLVDAARGMCVNLGIEDNIRNVARIGELIMNYLPELIKIPPRPKVDTGDEVGNVVLTDLNSGKTIEQEIKHYD